MNLFLFFLFLFFCFDCALFRLFFSSFLIDSWLFIDGYINICLNLNVCYFISIYGVHMFVHVCIHILQKLRVEFSTMYATVYTRCLVLLSICLIRSKSNDIAWSSRNNCNLEQLIFAQILMMDFFFLFYCYFWFFCWLISLFWYCYLILIGILLIFNLICHHFSFIYPIFRWKSAQSWLIDNNVIIICFK